MNCTKCGTPLQPEDRFCYYCGTPVAEPPTPVTPPTEPPIPFAPLTEPPTPVTPPTESPIPFVPPTEPPAPVAPPIPEQSINPLFGTPVSPQNSAQPLKISGAGVVSHDRQSFGKTVLGVCSIVAGCLIIVGILMHLLIGSSYQSALKEMWHGVEQNDLDGAVACMFPAEAEGQITAAAARMEPYMQDLHAYAEARYGEKYRIDVRVDEIDSLDASELERFNTWFENLSLQDTIKKVYIVEYTRSIKGAKGKEIEEDTCYVYRYDGSWYMLDTELLGLQDPL